MRSPTVEASRLAVVLVAIAALGIGACIIGPKQDDPDTTTSLTPDTSTGSDDTNSGAVADAAEQADGGKLTEDAVASADSEAPSVDAAGDGCVKPDADAGDGNATCGDAMGDAVSDAADGG